MGFFSWDCNGCGHPLLSQYAITEVNAWMHHAVSITPDHDITIHHNPDLRDEFTPCVWHRICWVNANGPIDFVPSHSSPDQGYFFDPEAHNIPRPKLNSGVLEESVGKVSTSILLELMSNGCLDHLNHDPISDNQSEYQPAGLLAWLAPLVEELSEETDPPPYQAIQFVLMNRPAPEPLADTPFRECREHPGESYSPYQSCPECAKV